jgi:hypothetical protein
VKMVVGAWAALLMGAERRVVDGSRQRVEREWNWDWDWDWHWNWTWHFFFSSGVVVRSVPSAPTGECGSGLWQWMWMWDVVLSWWSLCWGLE